VLDSRPVPKLIRHRVLLVLVLAGLAAALVPAFVTHAPNRLVSGRGMAWWQVMSGLHGATLLLAQLLIVLPALVLVTGVFMRCTRLTQGLVLLAATTLMAGLAWLAGSSAATLAQTASSASRTAPGAGCWLLLALSWLAATDALQRLQLPTVQRLLGPCVVLAPLAVLLASGQLDQLSLLKEYANRQPEFHAAVWRHLELVVATLLAALLIGLPLGSALFHRSRWREPVFSLLNVIQTLPSIALFGLLMGPLALLVAYQPRLGQLGISGIGLAPALIALTLYALLPVVRGTVAALGQVSAPAMEAARGMGLTQRQLFWSVRVPLAMPVLLSGIRVMAVQTVGLAVVAALIGAGGLGSLLFQGLFSGALDLVLLGVVPVVALALVMDAGFSLGALLWEPAGR
jgi:osmoprotectant transport system permease protein